MSVSKNIAVVGAGNLGKFIIESLLKKKEAGVISSVSVLTRPDSQTTVPPGATRVPVDYSSPSSLSSALSGVDIVVSTLGGGALLSQIDLAKAAKEAGVKLFVPSEFGNATSGLPADESFFGQKVKVQQALKEIGLPYTLFWTGPFPDFCLIPPFGFNFGEGKVTISGAGDAAISWTSRKDIGTFVAHVLTSLPLSELSNRTLRIQGDIISFNGLVTAYESKTGKKLDVTRRPQSVLVEAVEKNPGDFLSLLLLEWDKGNGVVGEPLDNHLFPGWNPTKAVDIVSA